VMQVIFHTGKSMLVIIHCLLSGLKGRGGREQAR
jgi:hypothetical protein